MREAESLADRIFGVVARFLIWIENRNGDFVEQFRRQYWRRRFGQLGVGTRIYGRVYAHNAKNITIGDFCTLNEGVSIFARAAVQIGDYVRISPHVIINTGGLHVDGADPPYRHYAKPVVIEDAVWIATGAQILPGVRVGKHSVVAAGAVVAEDVQPYTVVAGVPAKKIRQVPLCAGSGEEITKETLVEPVSETRATK